MYNQSLAPWVELIEGHQAETSGFSPYTRTRINFIPRSFPPSFYPAASIGENKHMMISLGVRLVLCDVYGISKVFFSEHHAWYETG